MKLTNFLMNKALAKENSFPLQFLGCSRKKKYEEIKKIIR